VIVGVTVGVVDCERFGVRVAVGVIDLDGVILGDTEILGVIVGVIVGVGV
jgi:hypothetical protein